MSIEMQTMRKVPDRLYMSADDLSPADCRFIALDAVRHAQQHAPKLSGASASHLQALWGNGFFGMQWRDEYLWYQEVGIRAFTMSKLAGRTIPMWIDDPTGKERSGNPKAKTRTTESGKVQVLIFRRAARQGQRKTVVRSGVEVNVPASYPGAPGRIGTREVVSAGGRRAGQISRFNIGVRWRHPGLHPRSFLYRGMVIAARDHGMPVGEVVATNVRWR